MSVGGDYSQPVRVNGYLCWNCQQVAEAKKGVNPADPSASSDGVAPPSPAFQFGGSLAGLVGASHASLTQGPTPSPGALDILA